MLWHVEHAMLWLVSCKHLQADTLVCILGRRVSSASVNVLGVSSSP